MRVSMDIELKDIPGQLLLALNPISELKGNLISVVHHHEKRTPRGTIPVQLVFEIDHEKLNTIISRFEDSGVSVVRAGEERFLEHGAIIMIGHIIHTDIQDTIDKIDSTGFAEVIDLSLSMPRIDQPSSALLKIDAVGKKEMNDAMSLLKTVAKEKDLLVIEPIDTELM